tara:strand:+ start:1611 stop:2060 length:450 start_codon:yes stop_codon:yes gene_type:complete
MTALQSRFFELFQWNVKTQVAMAIAEAFAFRILYQNGCTTGNPIDTSSKNLAVMSEPDFVPDADVEFGKGTLSLRDQIVTIVSVAEITLCNRLKACFTAVAIIPDEHLDEMYELVLGNSLHCFESIFADTTGDFSRATLILEGLEQESR